MNRRNARFPILLTLFSIAASSLTYADNTSLTFQNQQYAVAISNADAFPERNSTFELWFRTRNGGGLFGIVASDPGVRDYDRCLIVQNGMVRHYLWAANEGTEVIDGQRNNLADGNWHHVAVVLSEAIGQSLYVDGELERRGNLRHSAFDWADRFVIGYAPFPGLREPSWFNGDIDEVRFWSVPKTIEQVRAGMNVAMNGDEEGLVAYYRLDEGQGQSSADDSPNNFPMRLGNAAGQDGNDPSWANNGAPISGAIGELSTNLLNFPPIGVGREVSQELTLRNIAEQNDAVHRLNFRWADQGGAPRWLTFDPTQGAIDAGDETIIRFTVNTEGLQPGDYRRNVRLTSNARDYLQFDLPVNITVTPGVGSIHGVVYDRATDRPIPDATIDAVAAFQMSDVTDEEGAYSFEDIGNTSYVFRVRARDYLTMISDTVQSEDGENMELNFAMLHSICTPRPGSIETVLQFDDSLSTNFSIVNSGNGPLAWSSALDFPDELEQESWTARRNYAVSEICTDERVQAITYAGDNIYLAGAANLDKKIYVVSKEGELERTFRQLSTSRYGFNAITWDGENLWGAGDRIIYCFNTDGDSVTSFMGQIGNQSSSNVAWDSERELLWLSSATSDLFGCSRDGRVQLRIDNPALRIYGVGFYPEDPDGHKLYLFTNPDETERVIVKMNTDDGNVMPVIEHPDNGSKPAGCAITKLYDPYSWVFLGINNDAGNDTLTVWHLSANTSWISLAPLTGVVDAASEAELTVRFDTYGLTPEVDYTTLIRFNHDGVGGTTEVPVRLSVTGEGGVTQRMILLERGWNLISTNILPEGADDFGGMMMGLVQGGQLVLAKDGAGNFFWPAREFNGIEGWDPVNGYWLKMVAEAELRLAGQSVDRQTPISLEAGWNTVSYLPRQPIAADAALSELGENLVIARDGTGRFYLPAYGFNDLDRLREGKGYQLRVIEATEFIYSDGRIASIERGYSRADGAWLGEISASPSMHNLLIRSNLPVGTRLESRCGRGVVGEDGQAGMTIYGDDPTTIHSEGFAVGEIPIMRISGEENALKVKLLAGDYAFTDGGWGVVEIESVNAPGEFGLTTTYPNPFNSTLRISFNLPGAGDVRLGVFDIAGREVAQLAAKRFTSGEQSISWDADQPAGVYVVWVKMGVKISSRKVVLVK